MQSFNSQLQLLYSKQYISQPAEKDQSLPLCKTGGNHSFTRW